MSDQTANGYTSNAQSGECWLLRRDLAARIAEAEHMVSCAMRAGIDVNADDLAVVRRARHAFWHRSGSESLEIALHAAVTRIAKLVHYPSIQVAEDLRRADDMMSHAAFSGKDIAPDDVQALSAARTAQASRAWEPAVESAFYPAADRIAHAIAPVVANNVGAPARLGSQRTVRIYTWMTVFLTLVVVLLSCLFFVVNQLTENVLQTVQKNDEGAMVLHNQLVSYGANIVQVKQKNDRELRVLKVQASDEGRLLDAEEKEAAELQTLSNSQQALQIKESLQRFATNNRQLFNDVHRIRQIGRFLNLPVTNRYTERDPDCSPSASKVAATADAASGSRTSDWMCDRKRIRDSLEIKIPMLELSAIEKPATNGSNASNVPAQPESVIQDGLIKIAAYQDIRAMALYGRDVILSLVGAMTGFVLPVIYSWLGACAAILRKIKTECETCQYHPQSSKIAYRSHVTCAIIVGIAIGLFSGLVQGNGNISPLGIAFVAGYASEKFFYFVERLVDVMFPTHAPVTPLQKESDAAGSAKAAPNKGAIAKLSTT
ncbi:hypothetical protein [Burkholderia sp. Ac-20365]|jgi:hypothetical protein|uniref:hypothetical protein n=1 Tax=Burkholderia sp. Ac-20365 TaxID=2703897 RepID=UPI00197C96CF|nr:hypothetical protein [Burkholderia sp. Ac-20365]MBN3762179.1 hypothetical protein [Burkholderia sp. Ac-20365]